MSRPARGLRFAAIPLMFAAAAPAAAHVVADPAEGPAAGYQAVRFRVGHGCGQAATTMLRIEIPPEIATARPQPKPGWRLETARAGDRISAVAWHGELPGDQFDEFAVLFKLPAQAGPLRLAVIQTCGTEEVRWDQTSTDGPPPKYPAPNFQVLPAAGHNHQH
ncbi:MAG: YcnI family protein [Phenylobacterium sp.]|uniref:YcnI family copper-binding membrane protein n=1 Tax=Phenylobacterium sp. TaxID=1871053 RepID=UPI00391ACBC2